ncbi:MAG: hypothetical protein HC817_04955 [Saprospiraceae bacterium]|nr:hypothetical protein [Saprospiraceae bacterium]
MKTITENTVAFEKNGEVGFLHLKLGINQQNACSNLVKMCELARRLEMNNSIAFTLFKAILIFF